MASPVHVKTDQGFLGSVDIRNGTSVLEVAVDQSVPGTSNGVELTGTPLERQIALQEDTNRYLRAVGNMISEAFGLDPFDDYVAEQNQ